MLPHDLAGGSIMGNKKDNQKKENGKGINSAIIGAAIIFYCPNWIYGIKIFRKS